MTESSSRSVLPASTSVDVDDDLLTVAIVGRVTAEAIGTLAGALSEAQRRGRPFALLFDRRQMTAPTKEGRDALDRWADDELPSLKGHCVAWVDLFDQKRAASMARAAEPDEPEESDDNGYPQRTFTDPSAAAAWLRAHLDSSTTSDITSDITSDPGRTP